MSLDRNDILKIAELARLEVTEDQVTAYADTLSRILDLVERMNSVDTAGVVPMAHPLDMPLRLREDRVTEDNRREDFQQLAPATEAGLYLVPRVVE